MLGSKPQGDDASLLPLWAASHGLRTRRTLGMTLTRYTGNSPMRVSKDAKYSVTANGEIRLEFRESDRVRYLLTTDEHPQLVQLVNAVKQQIFGQIGGAFYINEYQQVLVPDGQGGACYVAGRYERT